MNLQRRWGGGGEGGGRDSTKQSRCSGAGWRSSHHFVPPPLVPGSQHCTVLLSLASEKLEDDDKTMIAVRLVSAKTKGDTFGTANLSQLTEKTELWDLVTSNSWELFILKMLLTGWPCPPPSGIPAWTTSSSETLSEQLRWWMTVLRGSQVGYWLQQVPHQGQPGDFNDFNDLLI